MKAHFFKSFAVVIVSVIFAVNVFAQAPAPVAEPLRSDPGNDYFARVNQMYKSAAMAGNYSLRDRYYQQSIPLIEDYLKLFPKHKNSEPAHYYLAESYFNTGKVREALAIYKKIVVKYKSGAYVAASTYRLARDFYSKKSFMTAAKYFGMTAKLSKTKTDKNKAYYYQAQAYLKAGKPKLASPLYGRVSKASESNPYQGDAALWFGKLSLQEGDYKASLKAFEQIIMPNQAENIKAEAAYFAGVSANGLKDAALAEKYFEMSLLTKFDKWKGESQTGLMSLSFHQKDYEGVIALLKRGKFQMADNIKAKQAYLLGCSCLELKRYTSAIHHFIDVEIHGKGTKNAFTSGYYKLLCFYNIKNSKIPKKVDYFLQGYAVNNGRHKFIHQALLMKAETLFVKGKYDKASKVYADVGIDFIDKKYLPELLFKKGFCLWKVSNFAGAANSLTTFVERFPANPKVIEALIMRAGAYAKVSNKGKALRDYDHVIKNSKNAQHTAIALQKSGVIQFHAKRYDDMIKRYKKLVDEHPKLVDGILANANYWISRAYFKQKKYKLGLKYLETSWQLDEITFLKQISMLRVIGQFSLKNHKETEKAVALAEKAGLQGKIPLPVYHWLGEYYYNNSDFKKAAALLEKGVEKGPASATPVVIWRYLSKSQLQNKQNDKAFISVSNLLSIEENPPRVADALLDKSKIQMALGNDADAKRTAESALEMNPVGRMKAELLKVVGDYHYKVNEPKKAANYYILLLDSGKMLDSYPQLLDRLSTCLSNSGNEEEAKRYAKQLKKTYPRYKREKVIAKP